MTAEVAESEQEITAYSVGQIGNYIICDLTLAARAYWESCKSDQQSSMAQDGFLQSSCFNSFRAMTQDFDSKNVKCAYSSNIFLFLDGVGKGLNTCLWVW